MIQSIIEILEQMKIGITDGEPSINGADMQTTAEQLEQLFHKHHVIRSAPCGEDECMWKAEYDHAVKEIGLLELQLRNADSYIRELSSQQDY